MGVAARPAAAPDPPAGGSGAWPLAVGVDIQQVDELGALLGRPWFRRYVYAAAEWQAAAGLGDGRRLEFLTGRFAAKEAVLKVLETGLFAGVAPREIEVLRAPGGAPRVRLRGAAARRARERGVGLVIVSIAHKRGLVVATALGLAPPGQALPDRALPGQAAVAVSVGVEEEACQTTERARVPSG